MPKSPERRTFGTFLVQKALFGTFWYRPDAESKYLQH